MMGAKAVTSCVEVVRFKNCVAASCWPVRMFQTSENVRLLMAATKMGLALRAASSAPRFRLSSNLSTWLP